MARHPAGGARRHAPSRPSGVAPASRILIANAKARPPPAESPPTHARAAPSSRTRSPRAHVVQSVRTARVGRAPEVGHHDDCRPSPAPVGCSAERAAAAEAVGAACVMQRSTPSSRTSELDFYAASSPWTSTSAGAVRSSSRNSVVRTTSGVVCADVVLHFRDSSAIGVAARGQTNSTASSDPSERVNPLRAAQDSGR